MKAIKIGKKIQVYSTLPSSYSGKKHYIGGFQHLSDSELENEGFFDVENPDYDSSIQELGALSFDADKNKYVYAVKDKTWADSLAELKAQKVAKIKAQAIMHLSSTDWYVTRQAEGIKDVPSDILAVRKSIRDKADAAETAVGKYTKKSDVVKYQISLI